MRGPAQNVTPMILNQWPLLFVFALLLQAGSSPPGSDLGLTAAEKDALQREQKIDNRIKIYDNASERLSKTIESLVRKDSFQSVPDVLKSWGDVLEMAAKDIDSNASRKKKSKALIRFEIRLRKEIGAAQEYKIRAPVDQQDLFNSWLNRAEEIRKKFVDILFPG